jgi:DNA-binding CsgD family transcriptional regulator
MTSKENKEHAIKTGLMQTSHIYNKGMNRAGSRYTDRQAHEICKLLEEGKHVKEVSDILGISRSFVNRLKYSDRWNHITSQYKIPKVGEIPRVKGSDIINTPEKIHGICRMLEQGISYTEIKNALSVSRELILDIHKGNTHCSYSKDYNIPKYISPRIQSDTREKILELLLDGNSYGNIIKQLGLPDTRACRRYIAKVKFGVKVEGSTTIESTISPVEIRSDGK